MSEKPHQFKEGDMVRLKSGGPALTVEDIGTNPEIVPVAWFAGDVARRDGFHHLALDLIRTKDGADSFATIRQDLKTA